MIDFSAYLRAIIQAGQVVEQTNIVEIVNDTGMVVGHATYEVVQSSNGVAQEVAVATTAGGTGVAAYTTGLAYMAADVSVVGAALAPALGVLAGTGLYNLAPRFWEDLAYNLQLAGKTIGGKVIAYWNGDNIHFDEETIEIFKTAFLNAQLFPTYEIPEYKNTGSSIITGRTSPTELLACALSNNARSIDIDAVRGQIATFIDEYYTPDKICLISIYSGNETFSGTSPLTIWISNNDFDAIDLGQQYAGTALYTRGRGYPDEPIVLESSKIHYNLASAPMFEGQYTNSAGYTTYSAINATADNTDNVQSYATYPDGRPIPQIYPNWLPWEYPVTIPSTELPTVYPVKYPKTEPDPYPTQEPAQNPQPEPAPVIVPIIIPELPLPQPLPEPQPIPTPTPDPDPQPEPDPIPEPVEPTPQPDPINPNPDPTPSPALPIVPLPATVASNKLFTVYNPSAAELNSLGAYLWDSSIIASIRDIWQNPLDGVISLIQVYATPPTSGRHNIILGFLDSGVGANVVSDQFITVDCGSVSVPEDKSNATDYAPYTSLHLYLPFIGIVELDTNECMNSTIDVKYKIDVYTGTCLATVSVTRSEDMPNAPILYTYSGNCSQQIPLTSGNATGMLTALIGGITAGLSVASGGGFGLMAGAQIATQTLTREMFHVSHSGNLSANAGIMGQKKPYLIIGRRHGYDANNYSSLYGFPANKTIVLGNHTGFVKVKHCFLKTTATQPEHDEIMSLLRNGVIL